jgi:glycosyl transferase family 25
MRLAYDIAFDLEYLAGLKAAFISPLCATQDADGESQIQNNLRIYRLPRWRYFTVLPYRAFLETSRFLLRGIRFVMAKAKVAMGGGKGKTAPASH